MDFHSLSRKELQSLCKLNKIPANITNVAMADALSSLNTVEGIEEILNCSRSKNVGSMNESPEKVEVTSPRVPRTSCRTSTRQKVKKTEVEVIPATASRTATRGVSRNIGGDVSELLKTPLVASTRKKVPVTASRQNVLSQLNECEEVEKSGATCNRRKVTAASARQNTVKKEVAVQSVYSTRRSTRLTAKKSSDLGVMDQERSEPVKISSFSDEVSETTEGDLDNPISEKITGSGSGSVETSNESSVSSDNTEDNVGEGSEESCDVGVSKVEDICSAFEKLDVLVGDQNLMTAKPVEMDTTVASVEEKEDCTIEMDDIKLNSAEVFEHHEKFDDFEEKSGHVDNIKPVSDGMSIVCEKMDLEEKVMVNDEKIDQKEALIVSENELNAYLAPDEHSEEGIIQVDDLKQDSEIISNLCDDGDSEEEMVVIDDQNDQHVALNVSLNEPNAYLAPEEHFEEEITQVEDLKQDSEVISDVSDDEELEEKQLIQDEKVDFSDAETDGTDSDGTSLDTENGSEDIADVLEMKNEVSDCIGSPNMMGDLIHFETEISSKMSKLDDTDKLNVVEEMTTENGAEDISKSTFNVSSVNLDGLDSNMDFETPKEAQDSLIDETPVYLNSEVNQETKQAIADDNKVTLELAADIPLITENQFSAESNDVIDHPSDIPVSIKGMTQDSENNENSGSKLQAVIAEEDKNMIEKTADEKPMPTSIRQLKKQLKALSIKSTNKDDKVVEARPALQAVCENKLATEELDD